MANFRSIVSKRQRELGGFKKAQEKAHEILNEGKRSSLNKNIENRNAFLEKGKLYTFNYNPINKEGLNYYDKNPLVLVVDRRTLKDGRSIDIAINLNFLPFGTKLTVLNKIVDAYQTLIKSNTKNSPNRANSQLRLPINWDFAKKLLGPSAEFAIRSYYTTRRSDTYCFSYEYWKDLIFLDVEDITGATIQEIYKRKSPK